MLSHELRTPLTAVLGAVGSLHEGAFPKEFRRFGDDPATVEGSEALASVGNLLDVTRINKGKIER